MTQYTVHPYDQVLGVYFAQARMYDAADRRFMAVDMAGGNLAYAQTMHKYAYVINNPLIYIDLFGLAPIPIEGAEIHVYSLNDKTQYRTIGNISIDITGEVFVNLFYALEGYGHGPAEDLDLGLNIGPYPIILDVYSPAGYNKLRFSIYPKDDWIYAQRYELVGSKRTNEYEKKQNPTGSKLYDYEVVSFDYFHRMMCGIFMNYKYEYNDILRDILNKHPNRGIIITYYGVTVNSDDLNDPPIFDEKAANALWTTKTRAVARIMHKFFGNDFYAIQTYYSTNIHSDHPEKGIDMGLNSYSSHQASPRIVEIVEWIAQNHEALNISYIIYHDKVIGGDMSDVPYSSWAVYVSNGNDPDRIDIDQHRDHVHLSITS